MISSIQGVTDTKCPYFVKETKTLLLDWQTTLQARQHVASRQAFELTYGATGAVQSAPIPVHDVVFERNGVVEAAYTVLKEKSNGISTGLLQSWGICAPSKRQR